ncbi:hypothetical protein ElyMa_001597800 [Elysia marginata]|uniref:MADF domain-containing protein n=1 Tax=Elysia marginata TaxID=1093978 RepID=A0AAV4JIP7_9GAST|nr:hypothetical protein ElyMa_001597800 [Elysia marginata]
MAIISISKADLPSTTRAFHGTVSEMDDESLILCVQQRPAIYDKKEKLHHNRDSIQTQWEAIAIVVWDGPKFVLIYYTSVVFSFTTTTTTIFSSCCTPFSQQNGAV